MVGAFTWLVNPGNCSGEQYGSTMLIESEAGDHSADPENGSTIAVGLRQSSQPVVVSGASGTRRTYLYGKDSQSMSGDSLAGTTEVLYIFVTGGRTYFAAYWHYPADPDLTADFDRMVTGTLKFFA